MTIRNRHSTILLIAATLWLGACSTPPTTAPEQVVRDYGPPGEKRCLQAGMQLPPELQLPELVIASANWRAANYEVVVGRDGETAPQPAHCELQGYFGEYVGRVGGSYRTAFKLRLPQDWNGRFFFQGGGGSNGVVGNAIGQNGMGNPSALSRGYAVIAQDSGHDNQSNNVPDYQGELVFGFDPAARANYGHASLKPSYDLGLALVKQYYGREAKHKFFWGCSKGGQEGMAFAQRYPESFDGIVAVAPGISLPRAAVAQAWDTQAFAGILEARGQDVTVENLRGVLTPADVAIVHETILQTCDSDDGVADGIISAIGGCTSARVVPALRLHQCGTGAKESCLDEAVVDALALSMGGAQDSAGKALYAEFPWDSGVGEPGWLVWKIGLPGGPPSLNVVLGGGSLAAVFSSPPTALGPDPEARLDWQRAYDFDIDAKRVYAITPPYASSPWDDVGMRATDLSKFRDNGSRLIVPHGMSDPVFSAYDTINWFTEVDQAMGGTADSFVRVFPVPGMNHCGGGPATDQFDSLTALENWVINGQAPDEIAASAGEITPWPGRRRPLCPYPKQAVPVHDNGGATDEFHCR